MSSTAPASESTAVSSPERAPVDLERRAAIAASVAVGGVGLAAGAVPYIASWGPSEREKAAGSAVDVDVSTIAPGKMLIVEWRGKPIWILRRTPEMVETLRKDAARLADPESQRTAFPTPAYALTDPATRSIRPELLVVVGICTHLGCSPSGPFAGDENAQLGDDPGFVCPCHGSTFDLAGRVFKNKPAADNLAVPPHRYLTDSTIRIGEDTRV
jgi:ubiquinol-cytochrome c reductase iron-sulfur subunit